MTISVPFDLICIEQICAPPLTNIIHMVDIFITMLDNEQMSSNMPHTGQRADGIKHATCWTMSRCHQTYHMLDNEQMASNMSHPGQ